MDAGQGTYTIYISQGVHNKKLKGVENKDKTVSYVKARKIKNTNNNSKDF